jgi:hypothetical protein
MFYIHNAMQMQLIGIERAQFSLLGNCKKLTPIYYNAYNISSIELSTVVDSMC